MIWGVQLFSETSDIVVCEGFFVLWCRCLMFKLKGRVISHQWPVSSTASFVTTFMTATACIVVTIFDMEYGEYIYIRIYQSKSSTKNYLLFKKISIPFLLEVFDLHRTEKSQVGIDCCSKSGVFTCDAVRGIQRNMPPGVLVFRWWFFLGIIYIVIRWYGFLLIHV